LEISRYEFSDDIRIFNLGDVHRGDLCCDDSLFRKAVKEIAGGPGCYWVSTGDLLNCAFKDSVSDSYKSKPLGVEFRELTSELAPIASKCLGFVKSNHHARFERVAGMSLDEMLADTLKIPFLGGSGVINVTVGRASYYIALHHGIGGGKMRGGKTNNLERLEAIYPGADIYMEGHTHTYEFFVNEAHFINRKLHLLSAYQAHFCTTGHFLHWKDSYGEDKKLRPGVKGCAVITLKSLSGAGNIDRKQVRGDLFN
jgi:hypothetical protein